MTAVAQSTRSSSARAPRGSPSAAALLPELNASRQRRPLETPAPAPPPERVVRDVLAGLADKRKEEVTKAQKAIQEFGLTIEVTRIRERLAGMPPTDLRRLLLATAGVPEALFLAAIAEQLEEEEAKDEAVTDTSVDDLGKAIQSSFTELSKALTEALKAIAERNGGSGTEYGAATPANRGARGRPSGSVASRSGERPPDPGQQKSSEGSKR